MTNTITALINLIKNPTLNLGDFYNARHKANALGDALEEYIKDLYAGTLNEENNQTRLEKIADVISYIGNDSNPPDLILKNGDAIEVKKIESFEGDLQLNSSHPKHKLLSTSTMINEACRNSDGGNWKEKDLLYVIGQVKNKKLLSLFMVYGIDYAASESVYLNIKNRIKDSVESTPNLEFSETNELAKFKRVDPLGITTLRVRGMWILQNPWKTFKDLAGHKKDCKFDFCAVISNEKYNSFAETQELEKLLGVIPEFTISNVKIQNPDNPALLKEAKLIRFTVY
mgnify:CR=1 FL=1